MTSLLIHQAHCISTQNDHGKELLGGSIYIENGLIKDVLSAEEFLLRGQPLLDRAERVIDARHHLVTPGLINCHHHMVQSLTRAVKGVQNAELFSWLQGLYPLWAGLTPEMIQVSHQVAMAELLLSGCTTSSDHLYIYPNGGRLEDSIQAAKTMGLRFTATRGSMSVGQSKGGLPPDRVVEKEADILSIKQQLIEDWHDAQHGSMLQIAVAPCSPFSVSPELMRESAKLARAFGVRLHTHLS